MIIHVQQSGNQFSLNIPEHIAREAGLTADMPVEIHVVAGRLVLRPIGLADDSLDSLVSDVTRVPPPNANGSPFDADAAR